MDVAKSQIRVGRKRITVARKDLDALLDELKNGQTRLPLFDRPSRSQRTLTEADPVTLPRTERQSLDDNPSAAVHGRRPP